MKNIYEHCPTYETESFILRLVKLEDAEDLLSCYSDKTNTEKSFAEIIKLTVGQFVDDFEIESVKIKTSNIPEKIKCIENFGFVSSKTYRTEFGYHEYNI